MKDYLKLHTTQVLYDTWKVSGSYIVPNVSLIEDMNGIMYNSAPTSPPLMYNFLDILWSDGTATQTVRPTTDGVTPIGLCVVPTGFFGPNEGARFMALKYAGGSSTGTSVGAATGSTTVYNQHLQWTLKSAYTDVAGLTNYDKLTSTTGPNGSLTDYQGGLIGSGCGGGEPIMLYTDNGTWKGIESGNELTGYALGDVNGKQNTDIVSTLGSLSDYPAFASVLNYYTPGTQAGDWYLPALGELAIICANKSRISPVLSNIHNIYASDCMPFVDTIDYWSSTEYSRDDAFSIFFNAGSLYNSAKGPKIVIPMLIISNTVIPTPMPSLDIDPISSPTPSPSPIPSSSPTVHPSPSPIPSSSPTVHPSPSPSPSVRPTPSPIPSSSPYVRPTPSPTPSETIDEQISTPARYLTFRGESDNSSFGLNTIATGHKVYYSKDLENWKCFNTTEDIEINEGEEVYVMGDSDGVTFASNNTTTFRMSGAISVTGDVTSILDYKTLDEKIDPYCYYGMFSGCTSLTQAPILPATTLTNGCYHNMFYDCTSLTQAPALPATNLAYSCYSAMFYGCTSLTQAPELPATTLTEWCYSNMFQRCTSLMKASTLPATTLTKLCYSGMFMYCRSLTQAPELPATTLADHCYMDMFFGCTSLTQAPALPATTLADSCYAEMFKGCTALAQAPALPATTLAYSCYDGMFWGCTSLTQAPALPTTALANSCYNSMFYGCTSLTQAPALPATTLTGWCYSSMFSGCISLTQAPALPATTLGDSCYQYMFYGCTNLSSITCFATDISASNSTYNWLSSVGPSGTFTKPASMTSWPNGASGIPNGWTVADYTT